MNTCLPDPLNSSADSSENSSTFNRNVDHIINGKEGHIYRKMFVGGLSWMSSVESLRAYFERFGPVEECVIMRDAKTKMTRGFGFVTFVDSTNVHKVLAIGEHYLDGKKIDPQIAIRHISPARSVNNICRKVFVGGVPQNCDVSDIKNYFSQFGQVEDAVLKMDYPKKLHRGFGFITFVESAIADLVCAIRYHTIIQDKQVECKKAQKKEFVNFNGDMLANAAQLIHGIPPDQLVALCNYVVGMSGANASNVSSLLPSEPIQPPMSPPSVIGEEYSNDPHITDFRRRIMLKYLKQPVE